MRREKHIAVIDPSVISPELDCFNSLVLSTKKRLTYHQPALFGLQSLESMGTRLDGMIILGSNSSVHDRLKWKVPLMQWLARHWEAGVPTLGICYGHQLLAYYFGGEVGFLNNNRSKRLGFYQTTIEKNRLFRKKQSGRFFYTHREIVTKIPPVMRVIATTGNGMIDGLEHLYLPIWSFQAHPESTESFVSARFRFKGSAKTALCFGEAAVKKFLECV